MWQLEKQVSIILSLVRKKIKMELHELPEELINNLDVAVDLDFQKIDSEEKEKEGFIEAASMVSFAIGMIIYISLFIYGTMIMKGVMEEKTNRIVEIMASSVKPFQLLMAKIIGIGAVGLTQYFLWVILMIMTYLLLIPILGLQATEMNAGMNGMSGAEQVDPEKIELIFSNLSELPLWSIVFSFIFYFLGGYLLYGSLFAAIGSASDDDGDLQSLTFPVSVPIIISFIISMTMMNDPFSNLARWASIIPLSSPIVMPARMAFGPPPLEIIASVLCLILGFLATVWIASKVYRTGILMYGKKVTLKEIAKWVMYKN